MGKQVQKVEMLTLNLQHRQSNYRLLLILATVLAIAHGLQHPSVNRRNFFAVSTVTLTNFALPKESHAAGGSSSPSLDFATSKNGMQWADAKIGTGQVLNSGSAASIDYALSTTGARYGSKIYSNSNSGAPYRWILGDGTTIKGIEEAILGNDDIPAMKSGGIRRVIIPPALAYERLAKYSEGCGANGLGPVPPTSEAFEEFQRFKNIYCNPNRAYQPDVVMDIKLYGKR